LTTKQFFTLKRSSTPYSNVKTSVHPAGHDAANGQNGLPGKSCLDGKNARAGKNLGGRPPKFDEPSRPITLTLPESTLRELSHIDPDRGRAIVKLVKSTMCGNGVGHPLVEIVEIEANTGLVVTGPSQGLRRIPFLHFVEVAPARYLLALDAGNDFMSLEIAINDVLDDLPQDEKEERELIVQLLEEMRRLRKTGRVSMAEMLFVTLDGKHQQ
jgi:hypothetical protein